MSNPNNQNRMNTCLLCIVLIMLNSRCNNHEHANKTAESLKPESVAPLKVSLDMVPPAKKIYLKTVPPPLTVKVPQTVGGFYTLQTEKANEKIKLTPPGITRAKLPLANFTNFNTDDGLASDIIYHGMMDKKGRLWFSTGNNISCYDGSGFSNLNFGLGSVVNNIVEDKSGNIWFATWGAGVFRYDGVSVTNFATREGLTHLMVTSIFQDKNGNLWFGTHGGGISRYDGESFTTYNTSNGLLSNNINIIAEDETGNIWVGTYAGGASRLEGNHFTSFTTGQGLTHNNVYSICADKSGILWFGTEAGVSYFDPADGKKEFSALSMDSTLLSKNVNAISEDRNGNLWFCTIGGGVCRYDGTRYTIFTTEQGLANNNVWNITEDKKGNLWFGTDGGGLSRYNGKAFDAFTSNQGLPKNRVMSIAEDNSGTLWFGTYLGGLSRYDGKEFISYKAAQGFPDNNINSIKQDKKGNLWFGTNGGLCRFDGSGFTNFTTIQGLPYDGINFILQDKSAILWVGTPEGVSSYDGTSFSTFTTLQGLANNSVTVIAEGPDGNLWFGTEGGGVSRYDGKSFTTYTVTQGLAHNIIRSLIKDMSGNLWFGTTEGVSRFDGSGFISFNTSQGLANNIVSAIIEDADGVIWFGTDKGFSGLKFNTALPGNERGEIKGAGLLKEKNEQLKTYQPVWEIYNNETGYPVKGLNQLALCITKRGLPFGSKDDVGMIWGGFGDEKVIRFDPKAVIKSNDKPIAFFKSIKIDEVTLNWYGIGHTIRDSNLIAQQEVMIYGKLVPAGDRDSLQKRFRDIQFDSISPFYQLPQNLVLPYRHNRVSIDFGAIETNRNFMVRYQYILMGYQNEWSPVTEKTFATFGNISAGNYTFKLKARSPEGIWSEPISYSFKVLPPWWRTWWAYIFYILLFFLTMYALFQWRTRSLNIEKIKLEEKVSRRTRELELRSSELELSLGKLKSTQSQLIQAEKMASLGELTAGIAHEIQNPLNFVNNFSEVNTELVEELKQEIDNGNILGAKAIAANIKENEEKINQHGKRADSIVKGMLQHSRKTTGQKEPTDINALADEYLRLSYHGLRAKDKSFNATIQTAFDPSIGTINIIPQDIGRVLLNLYNNAFYAVSEKRKQLGEGYEPTVSVTTKKSGSRIEIIVRDNGIGIPKESRDRIFQPFFTTKPAGQGTGLGLSISYDIIKAHGGELKVETKEGEFAEFIIKLPM